jgi:hypothetical protein
MGSSGGIRGEAKASGCEHFALHLAPGGLDLRAGLASRQGGMSGAHEGEERQDAAEGGDPKAGRGAIDPTWNGL